MYLKKSDTDFTAKLYLLFHYHTTSYGEFHAELEKGYADIEKGDQ